MPHGLLISQGYPFGQSQQNSHRVNLGYLKQGCITICAPILNSFPQVTFFILPREYKTTHIFLNLIVECLRELLGHIDLSSTIRSPFRAIIVRQVQAFILSQSIMYLHGLSFFLKVVYCFLRSPSQVTMFVVSPNGLGCGLP